MTDARDKFSKVVSDVVDSEEMFILTRGGKPAIALINIGYLEKLIGTQNGASGSSHSISPKPAAFERPTFKSDLPIPAVKPKTENDPSAFDKPPVPVKPPFVFSSSRPASASPAPFDRPPFDRPISFTPSASSPINQPAPPSPFEAKPPSPFSPPKPSFPTSFPIPAPTPQPPPAVTPPYTPQPKPMIDPTWTGGEQSSPEPILTPTPASIPPAVKPGNPWPIAPSKPPIVAMPPAPSFQQTASANLDKPVAPQVPMSYPTTAPGGPPLVSPSSPPVFPAQPMPMDSPVVPRLPVTLPPVPQVNQAPVFVATPPNPAGNAAPVPPPTPAVKQVEQVPADKIPFTEPPRTIPDADERKELDKSSEKEKPFEKKEDLPVNTQSKPADSATNAATPPTAVQDLEI